ncbi:ABC transporter ATP-binding protein [Demequina aurantiaca]|uniref:ABC transporter ATP-binding protein n=1 Tax=Demequina aurantiaca TaxID=676200 RepID=UPI0007814433|nr:ABC transporter ATP-binding protein [Demequina aurantiaca]
MHHPKHPEIQLDAAHPVRSARTLMRPHRKNFALAAGVFVLKDSPLWLLPVVTAAVVDTVVDGGPMRKLGFLAIAAAILLGQNYPFHMLFIRLFMGASRQIGADLRNALIARLQVLSIGFHSRASAAVVQTKLVRDVENVELAFLQVGAPALSATTVFVGAVVITAIQVPQFLPVYALAVPFGAGLWWMVRRSSARRNEEFRREVEVFSSRVGEMATLLPITRAHGLEHVAAERVAHGAENVRSAGLRLDILNGRFGALSWVSLQMLTVFCLIGAAAASISGLIGISAGQVVLLSTYFSLLTGAVTALLSLVPISAKGGESLKSIAGVLQEPDLEFNEGKARVESVEGDLNVENVTYQYPGASEPAIHGLNLHVKTGETVALVGSSGSGKSTLLNLVLGFLRPTDGRMLLDGVDMETMDLRTARRFLSVVPQESVMFEGSILDNVTYGLGEVPESVVWDALTSANARDFVDELPEGIHTMVGDRGARLSGGQRQRLSIARALIRDPRILLLDEATSALDTESEQKIQGALANLVADRTTLVVAHRLSTIRAADRIVVMERGRIVEVGSHDELLAAEGRYATLHRMQTR